MKLPKMFRIAAIIATRGDSKSIKRQYRLAAVAQRSDGVIVGASNISNKSPCPEAHAERRLCGMITKDAIVYVVRIDRVGKLRMAKPCQKCQSYMRNKKVRKVFYSISPTEYGILIL